MALHLVSSQSADPRRTLWVFRYYDLNDRQFEGYGRALVRLIDFIRALTVLRDPTATPKVNVIAHSMGGILVREAIQRTYPERWPVASRRWRRHPAAVRDDSINKIVTLGHAASGHQLPGHQELDRRRG